LLCHPTAEQRKVLAADHRDHLIYLGHLQRWDAAELRNRLRNLTSTDELNQLSLQLVVTGPGTGQSIVSCKPP
jgi:hypothetical protein